MLTTRHRWNPGLRVQQRLDFGALDYVRLAVDPITRLCYVRFLAFIIDALQGNATFIITNGAEFVEVVLFNEASGTRTLSQVANGSEENPVDN